SRLGHAAIYVRHAGSRRPGNRRRARNVWPRQHVARGDAGGHLGDAIRNDPVLALRQHQRCGVGFRRRDPLGDAALECGRAQLHDLYHWRYPGRGLRLRPSVEYRDRARRNRRRRRLYLLQSADRARALRRAGLHLQFREPVDPVPERRRHAFRLERVAVPDQAVPDRSGGLRLQGNRLRQRLRRPRRLIPVAGDRSWSAARLHVSGRRPAGLSQSEVLQRIFSGEPSPRLEHLGHVHDFAACTHADRATATNDHEIAVTRQVSRLGPKCEELESGHASWSRSCHKPSCPFRLVGWGCSVLPSRPTQRDVPKSPLFSRQADVPSAGIPLRPSCAVYPRSRRAPAPICARASGRGTPMKLPRRQFLHLAAGAAALPAVSRFAWAQAYPTRPVRLIVPIAPAGAGDITARLIGQWLSERLGQQFVIDNRPGGGNNIGTEAVVRAPADGYTLLLCGTFNATNAALFEKLNYNFIRDIAPI